MARPANSVLHDVQKPSEHPVGWQNLLASIEKSLPCFSSCLILRWPKQSEFGVLVTPHGDPSAMLEFQRRSFAQDPFMKLTDGKVRLLRDVWKGDKQAAHPYFQHFMEPHHIKDILSLDILDDYAHGAFRFRFVRAVGEPYFGTKEQRFLETMIPSLRTAASFYARAVQQDIQLAAYGETTEQLGIASFVLDDTRQIMAKNSLADEIVKTKDGLLVRNQTLFCTDADSNNRLRAHLDNFTRRPAEKNGDLQPRSLFIRRNQNDGYWSLLLRPVAKTPALDAVSSASVIVLIRGQRHTGGVSDQLLMNIFGLTPKESEVVRRLADGHALYAVAEQLGISRGTARVHLRSIFGKVNVNSQSQLVSAVLHAASGAWDY